MIDKLVALRPRVRALDAPAAHELARGGYLVVTLHRPALVDADLLAHALSALDQVAKAAPVAFPIHPRTAARMRRRGLGSVPAACGSSSRLGMSSSSVCSKAPPERYRLGWYPGRDDVSGDPVFTLRANMERPVTCEMGTPGWDGRAAERLVDVPEAGVPDWDDLVGYRRVVAPGSFRPAGAGTHGE
jgi:UDP-N-acetylglucosamine 2-epimerase (non-hydrolysing)